MLSCMCQTLLVESVQNGTTALHAASWNGHCEVVGLLLDAKADISIKNNVSLSASLKLSL